MQNKKPETFTRAREAILDYLIAYGMSRIHDNDESEYPRTYGASVAFVSCTFSSSPKPAVGDLIRLESAPQSKWRLSWLADVRKHAGGDCEYLCKSIVDGELCWWSNVGVSFLHRKTLENHPSWKWTDDQFDFNDRWHKACNRHDPYLYRPMTPVFNEDCTATVGTRLRHNFDGRFPTAVIANWRKITIKALAEIYLSLVDKHKTQEPRP
jgi:hypothetical protein